MVLVGKLSTELGIKASADKFYNLFASQLPHVQNLCERVHGTKLRQGQNWHHPDSVKQWTYVIDGQVNICNESVEEVDEQNKKIIYKLFGGDIKIYNVFKLTLEVIDKDDGSAIVKWSIDYEKIHENIDAPNGWMDYLSKCTRDMDASLIKA